MCYKLLFLHKLLSKLEISLLQNFDVISKLVPISKMKSHFVVDFKCATTIFTFRSREHICQLMEHCTFM